MMTDAELDKTNARFQRTGFLWPEVELPEIREKALAAGFVPHEMILDEIVKVDELLADPHEVWRPTPWCSYCSGWYRVEIEG